MKALFLVSSPGQGHRRCAEAVAAAMRARQPDVQTDYLDIHDIIDERVSRAIIEGYLRMTAEQPALYQRLYDLDSSLYRQLAGELPPDKDIADFLSEEQRRWFPEVADKPWYVAGYRNLDTALINTLVNGVREGRRNPANRLLMRGLLQLIYRILAKRLKDTVQSRGADVLVATQMYPAVLLRRAVATGAVRQPLIGVITDYGVHGVWLRSGVHRFCVGHESVARELRSRGVSGGAVHVTGIPLMPGFESPPAQVDARRRLGLDQRPTLLVTGGELAIGVIEAVERLLDSGQGGFQVLVTGRARGENRGRLQALEAGHPERLRVYPWSEEMATLMRAADLVAGKPGGLSVSESLACGRPFLATCSLGGQEGHNLRFLERYNLGRRVAAPELAAEVRRLFESPAQLHDWQRQVAGFGQRSGADRVTQLALHCAGEGVSRRPLAAD